MRIMVKNILLVGIVIPLCFAYDIVGADQLNSLHGTMIVETQKGAGTPFEVWAKGNKMRTEVRVDGQKIVSLQLGDVLYTYLQGDASGEKQSLGVGLASMGLIEQIKRVKKHGIKSDSVEVTGVRYDKYRYDVSPEEWVIAYLEPETSLPGAWISGLLIGGNWSIMKIFYRNLMANVEIPDEYFRLPSDIHFAE